MNRKEKTLNGLYGAVTLSFDDGWKSSVVVGGNILNSAGIKGTFYIISGALSDKAFKMRSYSLGTKHPPYASLSDVRALSDMGHEIGAHSHRHPDLTTLSQELLEKEIATNVTTLHELGFHRTSFAYPYGKCDDQVIAAVKDSGFLGARSTILGYNDFSTNPFQLKCQAVKVDTLLSDVHDWIDHAVQNNLWLILMFHQIDHDGKEWSCRPGMLEQIVTYIEANDVMAITVEEGLRTLGEKS
jgi:peptidoglycan/xylan/chitin deacetylase (PgdA/CDA1 family)